MNGPIVVGTDGSDTAKKAVTEAISFAKAFDQPLHVVIAYHTISAKTGGLPSEFSDTVRSTSARTGFAPVLKDVDTILAEVTGEAKAAGVTSISHPHEGDAADAILDTAEEVNAAVIVIGNRGIGSKRRFLLGNVPSKVVHNSPCSTFVVNTS